MVLVANERSLLLSLKSYYKIVGNFHLYDPELSITICMKKTQLDVLSYLNFIFVE